MHLHPAVKRAIVAAASALAMATVPPAHAQAPGIVGIDHVGINVPDLNQAIAFFRDTLGFEPVTRLGPFPLDANWKKQYHLHDGTREVTLVMLRAGDGSNIELFAYTPASGSTDQPHRDDIAATHIALYTRDINAAKAFLEAKGVKFLSGINGGAGDTEGESWVYFETPWGATMELNSYPNGKAYEKRNPAVHCGPPHLRCSSPPRACRRLVSTHWPHAKSASGTTPTPRSGWRRCGSCTARMCTSSIPNCRSAAWRL